MDITYKHFNFKSAPLFFYDWCIKNKLYKDGMQDHSRMQLIYSAMEPFSGLSAVVAFNGEKPVGIVLCEHRELKKEKSARENAELSFYSLGFLNIYVKKSQRGKGIATTLVHEMEKLRLSQVREFEHDKNASPFFVSQQLAKVIVSHKAKYAYAIGSDIEHRGRQMEIDNIAYHKTANNSQLMLSTNSSFQIKPSVQWEMDDLNVHEVFEIPILVKKNKPR